MKMIRKIATIALGLACLGSTVFAQSLADAKKAIDVEQYQKAKAMLKNLTVTQAKDDETFFQLGWVYILQDYIDSAKTVFNQGITAHPKSALNYVGLGVVARLSKDNAGATANFNKAVEYTGKKESKPWLYMGKGYLLLLPNTKAVTNADGDAAIAALGNGKKNNPKDLEVLLELGNAYRAQKGQTGPAYENYIEALNIDPKYAPVKVAQGVLYSNAHNFEDGVKLYKEAIAIDPNYAPAYREWAETDKDWAIESRAVAVEKINEAVEQYKKYLSLTDESDETLMRYADFLISAGRWKELQEVSAKLAKSGKNIRAFRYGGYAGFENKDYEKGLQNMREWFAKAAPNRILPRDYFYHGRLKIASGQDTVAGLDALKKAAELDSTLAESAYPEVVNVYRKQRRYNDAANTYMEFANRMRGKAMLTERISAGVYYYFAFTASKPADSTLLVKADAAIDHVIKTATVPVADAYLYKARIADLRESKDPTKMIGLAKPHYDKYVEIVAPTFNLASATASVKQGLPEAYAYLGNYALNHDKDDAKAMEFYTKAREIDPNNRQAKWYFDQKAAPAATAPAPKKATK